MAFKYELLILESNGVALILWNVYIISWPLKQTRTAEERRQ